MVRACETVVTCVCFKMCDVCVSHVITDVWWAFEVFKNSERYIMHDMMYSNYLYTLVWVERDLNTLLCGSPFTFATNYPTTVRTCVCVYVCVCDDVCVCMYVRVYVCGMQHTPAFVIVSPCFSDCVELSVPSIVTHSCAYVCVMYNIYMYACYACMPYHVFCVLCSAACIRVIRTHNNNNNNNNNG